jgi:hypothetical protein
MQTVGGRLSHKPLDDMPRFGCAGKLHAPAGYETRPSAVELSDNTLQVEFRRLPRHLSFLRHLLSTRGEECVGNQLVCSGKLARTKKRGV